MLDNQWMVVISYQNFLICYINGRLGNNIP